MLSLSIKRISAFACFVFFTHYVQCKPFLKKYRGPPTTNLQHPLSPPIFSCHCFQHKTFLFYGTLSYSKRRSLLRKKNEYNSKKMIILVGEFRTIGVKNFGDHIRTSKNGSNSKSEKIQIYKIS